MIFQIKYGRCLSPAYPVNRGGIAKDKRLFINAVFWIMRTGVTCRPIMAAGATPVAASPVAASPVAASPVAASPAGVTRGVWENLLEILIDDPDYEWLMIDASHCKAHPHAAGARGRNQDISRTKGGSTPKYIRPWMRMACRSDLIITGTRADCTQAGRLIEGITTGYLLADRGYDTNAILEQAENQGMSTVIPSRKTAQNNENTIKTSANYGIGSGTPSCTLKSGAVSPQDTRKTPHLSSPPCNQMCQSDAAPCGPVSRDYII